VFIVVILSLGQKDLFGQARFVELLGWGGGEPEKVIPEAAETGFTDIAVWSHAPAYLKSLIRVGQKYNIGIYAAVTLNPSAWKEKNRYAAAASGDDAGGKQSP